jgi:RNA recognition motif-containing protein
MRICVGNLPFTTTEEDLAQLFHAYGEMGRVQIITDRDPGRSRGFGFVEMPNATEAQAAIERLASLMAAAMPVALLGCDAVVVLSVLTLCLGLRPVLYCRPAMSLL